MSDIPALARGKWAQILPALGVPANALTTRHVACPRTGEKGNGSPRFRFANRDGKGNYFCQCSEGNEDGFGLLQCLFGWDFKQAVAEVAKVIGAVGYDNDVKKVVSKERASANIKKVVDDSEHIGREVQDYLGGRGIQKIPPSIREVRTSYAIGQTMTAMVARIRNQSGHAISAHLTYIKDGKPAQFEGSNKIVMTPITETIKGGAIRLRPPRDGILGIAEGIETALSAFELFAVPTWAVISSAGMENFEWPDGIRKLVIFADNDAKFGGQKAAYVLAHRIAVSKRPIVDVTVELPTIVGLDWNDIAYNRNLQPKEQP